MLGGGHCTLDGADVPCSFAHRVVALGAGVPCPNNACTGYTSDGRVAQFRAFTTGAGYYPVLGPGAPYFSFEAAGIAAGLAVDEAEDGKVEWGAEIYRDANGIYSFTEPRPGTPTGYQVDPSRIPSGAVFVGDVHTHLRGGSHTFTLQDQIRINDTRRYDANYLGAFLVPFPGDVIWIYRPGIDTGWGKIIYRPGP